MRTITIANQKGGVGKTTTAHILCAGLAKRRYRVLAIDMDPQFNLTYTAGVDLEDVETGLYEVMQKSADCKDAVYTTNSGFDIIPGSPRFAGADKEFTDTGREYILREALESIENDYDYCVIDTPTTLGILTTNALTASHKIIVPMDADVYSMQGLSQLQGLIANVKKYCNPGLIIDGLLLTKYTPKVIINRQIKESLQAIADQLKTKVYDSSIRVAVAIKESQFLQSDIFAQHPNANVTKDYTAFIDEFLRGEGV